MNKQNRISRRSFIRSSSTAGLVLGAPSILRAGSKVASSNDIRVGFIGCGMQHEVLYEAMRNLPGIRFVAACDIMENDRLKATFGRIRKSHDYKINMYTDAETMLTKEAKNLDAVFITTPDFWHAPHTNMALEAGVHVYCEKMMSDTIEGARSMVRTAEQTGKLCQIGHQRRSNPRYLYVLNELINKHRICGDIINVNGQWNRALSSSTDKTHPKPDRLPDADTLRHYGFGRGTDQVLSEEALRHRFLNWRQYRSLSGGPISDLGAHQIDVFNWFLGAKPVSVTASGGHGHFTNREHYDSVMCIFDYQTATGNQRAFYQVLTTTSAGGGYYESFMGTEGTIEISERESFTNIYKESAASNSPKWKDLLNRGALKMGSAVAPTPTPDNDAIGAYASAPPDKYRIPGGLHKPPHQPHIENFFAAIRGEEKLNCDAREAFESEAPIYWVNPAAERKEVIQFTNKHLSV